MKRLIFKIPKISIWVTSIIISVQFFLWMILGYFVAKFIAGKKTGIQGRIPNLTFNIKKYRVHLHHWFACTIAAAVFYSIDISSMFLYGMIGGSIYQGLFHYKDWHKIIKKNAN